MENIQYPVGRFRSDPDITAEKRAALIRAITELPVKLRRAVGGLSASQLDTPYREGGWTPRQITHHLADSHLNSYCRFKLALTEGNPTIKPYDQDAWAATTDSRAEVEPSLRLLEGLHERWGILLASLTPADFARTFQHPESGPWTLDKALQLYGWHSLHHVAQIEGLRDRKGWR
ncbi:MAG TPA: bacillithiol transferase BstA [Spirochaetia bacterium]|nr:bacillithiol transferase BstA [Spirochaetia bacterium]